MRASLTARFVSHPTIHFTTGRSAAWRARLGLGRSTTIYHGPSTAGATVRALRSQTSSYRFAGVRVHAQPATTRSSRPGRSRRSRRA